MTDRIHALQVGGPDPELRNSPIVEETDDDYEIAARTFPDEALCYFNGDAYQHDRVVWPQEGSCDPDNPSARFDPHSNSNNSLPTAIPDIVIEISSTQ